MCYIYILTGGVLRAKPNGSDTTCQKASGYCSPA